MMSWHFHCVMKTLNALRSSIRFNMTKIYFADTCALKVTDMVTLSLKTACDLSS
jgi:hypothetical protein